MAGPVNTRRDEDSTPACPSCGAAAGTAHLESCGADMKAVGAALRQVLGGTAKGKASRI